MKRSKAYMPTLFSVADLTKDPPPVHLDSAAGEKKRDEGIKNAIDHAEKEIPSWGDMAYAFLLNFLANHNGSFMAEEMRVYAEQMSFEVPPSKRSWGSVIVRAAKNGLIKQCGTNKVRNPTAHRANAAVWRQI